MGGLGSGIGKRKTVVLKCKWHLCQEEFAAKRKDALFCSKSCQDAHRAWLTIIAEGIFKCRICGKNVKTSDTSAHCSEHMKETLSQCQI